MAHEIVATERAPQAIGPYSQAIRAGNMLFVSGQLGINPATGDLVGTDFVAQTEQALLNLKTIITEAGFTLHEVTAVDVFVTDIKLFPVFNDIYKRYFFDYRPARAVVEVRGLPKNGLVEIKCVAVK